MSRKFFLQVFGAVVFSFAGRGWLCRLCSRTNESDSFVVDRLVCASDRRCRYNGSSPDFSFTLTRSISGGFGISFWITAVHGKSIVPIDSTHSHLSDRRSSCATHVNSPWICYCPITFIDGLFLVVGRLSWTEFRNVSPSPSNQYLVERSAESRKFCSIPFETDNRTSSNRGRRSVRGIDSCWIEQFGVESTGDQSDVRSKQHWIYPSSQSESIGVGDEVWAEPSSYSSRRPKMSNVWSMMMPNIVRFTINSICPIHSPWCLASSTTASNGTIYSFWPINV